VKKKLKLTPEITEKIEQLADKFSASGQDLSDYLEGLLYNEYITYWDYIHLDVIENYVEAPFPHARGYPVNGRRFLTFVRNDNIGGGLRFWLARLGACVVNRF